MEMTIPNWMMLVAAFIAALGMFVGCSLFRRSSPMLRGGAFAPGRGIVLLYTLRVDGLRFLPHVRCCDKPPRGH